MDSTNLLPQIDSAMRYKESLANELFAAASPAMLYARDPRTSGGLVWGWLGGRYNSTAVDSGTATLTPAATTYMVADRTTGAVSFATASTDWDNTDDFLRLHKIVAGAVTVTSWEDHRSATGGMVTAPAWGDLGGSLADQADLQDALDDKLDAASAGVAGGLATLDGSGKLSAAQLPDLAVTDYLGTAASQTAMTALTGQKGDWCVRSDDGKVYLITGTNPANAAHWTALSYPTQALVDDSVTNAKLANMATATLKGRTSAGSGDPEDLTAAQAAALLGQNVRPKECIYIACSDESTALAAGTAKVTFRMPYAFTLSEVRASLTTAQASGAILTVDVNEAGTSVLSTKLTIDNTEKTSTTAATAAVISDASLADDAEITVDIDQVGDGTAKGLKVLLIGSRT